MPRPLSRRGFTLVEILIVVIILGILAAIVLPQFSDASHQAREATLRDDLRFLRSQINVFTAQHSDVSPGLGSNGAGSAELLVSHLTGYTDLYGNVVEASAADKRFGPYLSRFPANPLNGSAAVRIVTGTTAPVPDDDDTVGWVYNPTTRVLIPNLTGADRDGVPYRNY